MNTPVDWVYGIISNKVVANTYIYTQWSHALFLKWTFARVDSLFWTAALNLRKWVQNDA